MLHPEREGKTNKRTNATRLTIIFAVRLFEAILIRLFQSIFPMVLAFPPNLRLRSILWILSSSRTVTDI
jgi:hypothetical protein